jgi:colanic acid/amylovoran biosynthesis glycosyltransferase
MQTVLDVPQAEANPMAATCSPRAAGRRIAYLLSRYPAVSHSFFLNEILQLRRLGLEIEVASINSPDRSKDVLPPAELEESARTYYVKHGSRLRAGGILLQTMLLRPGVFYRGLKCALELGGWDLHAKLYALFYLAEALLVGDWMRRRGCSHLHVHFSTAVATVGMLAASAWRIPYSLSVHGPDEFHNVGEYYLEQKVARAKFVFCISDFCRSQLMRLSSPDHWKKLEVIRLGVDPAVFAPRCRQERGAGDTFAIVCVGRLVPAKGQLILLRALAELLEQGFKVRLQLVGEGEDRRHLEAFVGGSSTLSSAVEFKGALSHEETRKVLEGADLFVLPSFAEGLPVALMEAMAMEIPCISTYVAGIPELIRDGVEGRLLPASSEVNLVSAIREMIEYPQQRRRLAAAGRQRVLALHDLTENARRLAVAFETNLASNV